MKNKEVEKWAPPEGSSDIRQSYELRSRILFRLIPVLTCQVLFYKGENRDLERSRDLSQGHTFVKY